MSSIAKPLIAAVVLLGLLLVCVAGFLFSDAGLPNIEGLRVYLPAAKTVIVAGPCRPQKTKADRIDLLSPLFTAYSVMEDEPTTRLNAFVPRDTLQIARTMLCDERRSNLRRDIDELRLASQLHRRYSNNELLAIELNRAYLGDGMFGAEDAAEHYFNSRASALTLSQSALLVGLLRQPAYFSPTEHPDRALVRRNLVLDSMAERGVISAAAARQAKSMPLDQ